MKKKGKLIAYFLHVFIVYESFSVWPTLLLNIELKDKVNVYTVENVGLGIPYTQGTQLPRGTHDYTMCYIHMQPYNLPP